VIELTDNNQKHSYDVTNKAGDRIGQVRVYERDGMIGVAVRLPDDQDQLPLIIDPAPGRRPGFEGGIPR
jgi:hypothetical protein